MRSLSHRSIVGPGGVEEDYTGVDTGLPRLFDGRLGESAVVAAHPPKVLLSPQAHVPTPRWGVRRRRSWRE